MNKFFAGFMIDQRIKSAGRTAISNGSSAKMDSKKAEYSGTLAGTNGLRTNTSVEVKHAGDEAVAGVGGV